VELRGFEKFCIGRPVEELPRIVTSICGVCPWHHHLASAKANDAIFGVTPPPTGKKLRDLCQSIAYCSDKILHFFFLAGPDFVMGPDADYSVRKSIHPVTAVPGGFSKPLTEAERKKVVPMANEVLEFAKFAIAFAKESIFPKYLELIKSVGIIETGFLGTVTDDGTLELYDGKARLMKPDGSYEEFQYDQYTEGPR